MQASRRHFLTQVGKAAAAGALVAGQPLRLLADPLGRPIGLQLYTVGQQLKEDSDETLKKVAAIGYRVVETAGLFGKKPAEVKKSLDDAGLKCLSLHIWSPGGIQETIPYASELGAKYVISSATLPRRDTVTLDDYKAMAEHCNQLGREAQSAGLQFGYHNHNFEFKPLAGGIGYDELLKSTDPGLVKFELDCGWMAAAGHDPAEYLTKYPDRYRLLHIKDFKPRPKPSYSLAKDERPAPAELGRGHIDYKPIFAAAAKSEVEQYFVEQEPPFAEMPALEAIKVDYDYLHKMS